MFFYRNIFSVSHFTVLYPYRPTGGGRDLHVNKYIFFCVEAPGGSLPPPAGRQAPAAWWRGGRQPARLVVLRRWNYLPHPSSLPLPSLGLVGRK